MVMILLMASTFLGLGLLGAGHAAFIANAMGAGRSPRLRDPRDPGAVLHPRLAARMGADRGHHRADLHADPAGDEGRHGVVLDPARGHAADLLALAAGRALGVLPEGNHAEVGALGHLQGDDAVHGAAVDRRHHPLLLPQIILVLPNLMFGTR
jgi:hypothetical protein